MKTTKIQNTNKLLRPSIQAFFKSAPKENGECAPKVNGECAPSNVKSIYVNALLEKLKSKNFFILKSQTRNSLKVQNPFLTTTSCPLIILHSQMSCILLIYF